MSATLYERCIALMDRTYELANEAVDEDMAQHWSVYNGAATALAIVLENGGAVTEDIVAEYELMVAELDYDTDMEIKHPEITVKLIGNDGDPFAIMGAVSKALRRAGIDPTPYVNEAMSGDYDHLLPTTRSWVTVK